MLLNFINFYKIRNVKLFFKFIKNVKLAPNKNKFQLAHDRKLEISVGATNDLNSNYR